MDKVVKSNNRFKAILSALHQHIDVTIQRTVVERGRRSRCVNPRGLYATPFNAKTKSIKAKTPATREIFRIASPEVGRFRHGHDVALPFSRGPVRLRLVPTIVPTFGLVG
jgi:hypothetical protein